MTDIEKIKSVIRSAHSDPKILMIDNIVCVCQSDSKHDNDNLTEILKELMSFAETVKNVEGDSLDYHKILAMPV